MPILGDALTHGACEILLGIAADASFRVGRDVGGEDGAQHGHRHLQAARKGRCALSRGGMAGNAVARLREVAPALDQRLIGHRLTGFGDADGAQQHEYCGE